MSGRTAAIVTAVALVLVGCAIPAEEAGSREPSVSTALVQAPEATTTTDPVPTTTLPEEEWWPWVEVSGEGAQPDERFLDVEPPHMAVWSSVVGAVPEDGDDWDRGENFAGIWTNPFEEYFIGVAGPNAEEVAARAAATAEALGADHVFVYLGNHTEADLLAIQHELVASDLPFLSAYTDTMGNRVVIDIAGEDESAWSEAIADYPQDAVHLAVFEPEPLPEPGESEISYSCGAVPALADGTLLVEPLDAEAEAALLDLFENPEGGWLPGLEYWGMAEKTDDLMVLGASRAGDGCYEATFEKDREGRWSPTGWGGGGSVQANLPGYGVGTWTIGFDIDESSPVLTIDVTEMACANGEAPDGRAVVPVVDETGDAVVITVFIEPVEGGASCPGNPSFELDVELPSPLGDRSLIDGSTMERRP